MHPASLEAGVLSRKRGSSHEKRGELWNNLIVSEAIGKHCGCSCHWPRSRAREHRGGTRAARVFGAEKRVRRGGTKSPFLFALPCARKRASGGQRLRLWKPPGISSPGPIFLMRRMRWGDGQRGCRTFFVRQPRVLHPWALSRLSFRRRPGRPPCR